MLLRRVRAEIRAWASRSGHRAGLRVKLGARVVAGRVTEIRAWASRQQAPRWSANQGARACCFGACDWVSGVGLEVAGAALVCESRWARVLLRGV